MLIEAFASGVAVVASDSGEIPNVAGDAAMIVPEADDARWVAAIEQLLDDARFRSELAARGIERARSCYSWPVIARKHIEFFGELLDSSESPPSAN
jgi:glycosyltransferase involved in cell wall biosynthesis